MTAAAGLVVAALGCGGPREAAPAGPALYRGSLAPVSQAAEAAMLEIPAGWYIAGSTAAEREAAYVAYRETAGHDSARKNRWFEREQERSRHHLPRYVIDVTPVTMAAYAEFVGDAGHRAPTIDEAGWKRQGFIQDFATEVARYRWTGGTPPAGREDHPVVLVSWADAAAYCRWRGELARSPRRLPTAAELEKAARGSEGNLYPWGESFEADRLNSAVGGPRDLIPVGSKPGGVSPYGMLDAAGNVFQWTSTPWPHGEGRMTVAGSAWDDFAGVGRGASRHGRRSWIRHAIVGFRCAGNQRSAVSGQRSARRARHGSSKSERPLPRRSVTSGRWSAVGARGSKADS
jgi:formylglycine-generating enzyme required for sulfatase activity